MMLKNRPKNLAMLVFLLLFFGVVFLQKAQLPRVLVVHSYNVDYSWVTSINEGLDRVFDTTSDALIRYHYMDLKNHTDEAFQRTATSLAQRIVKEWQPDVLVLFDDAAQRLVGKVYVEHHEEGRNAPEVVFGGVNGDPKTYYGDSIHVTGIREQKPLEAIRDTADLILQANPELKGRTDLKVRFIGDKSRSITAEIPYYTSIKWGPLQWDGAVQVDTFEAWKEAVEEASRDVHLILLTNYQQIRDGEGGAFIRPANQVMKWTEANASVPVLGMGWTNSQDGAMISVSVSPYEQGDVAARKTLQILDGAVPADLGIALPNQFLVHMCQRSLEARELPMPRFYEAFARATDNFYQEDC